MLLNRLERLRGLEAGLSGRGVANSGHFFFRGAGVVGRLKVSASLPLLPADSSAMSCKKDKIDDALIQHSFWLTNKNSLGRD